MKAADTQAVLYGVEVELWQRLCDVADCFKRLAPWRWMSAGDIFGIRLSSSGQIGFVSIAGQGGGLYACSVLLGWSALARLRLALERGGMTMRDLVEIPQLQLCFEDRGRLRPREYALLRKLGRGYRGRRAWPVFRSHRAGYLPWMLDRDEAGQLAGVVHQALGVALRLEDQPDLLTPPLPGACWVRGQDADGNWHEEWLSPPAEMSVPVRLDRDKVRAVAALPTAMARVQADLSLTRACIGRGGARPQAAYMLTLLDGESGACLGADLVQALEGAPAMWQSLPDRVLDMLARAGARPREIEVASGELQAALRPLLGALPLKLTRRGRLDRVEAFREGMPHFYGTQGADEEDEREDDDQTGSQY